MTDRSKVIFGNPMPDKVVRKAERGQAKMIRRYGDDRGKAYHLALKDNAVIGESLGVRELVMAREPLESLPENPLVVGNIRMGFGHYRISMAIASAAHALGYTPLWLDLNSFRETTGGKIIAGQNDLYSLGSRLSQQFWLFNRLVWEPMNSEGFRHLSYNAADQKNAELMTPILADLPRDIPYVATHVWPAQAAVHAGLTNVVNAVPDNWPMALHLAEGAMHTVQTPSAYLGYRALRGMDKGRDLKAMPRESIAYTGHYIDHELVSHLPEDCDARVCRAGSGEPLRYLLTVGGAGAQKDIFVGIIRMLLPQVREKRAALFINVGDHRKLWDELCAAVPELRTDCDLHFDDFPAASAFTEQCRTRTVTGIHAFCHDDIFAAVYITNLLMRVSDVLITKPSELAFYPVPKLMIHRVGGHEAWGAIRSAEVGDGTYECDTMRDVSAMLRLFAQDDSVMRLMCAQIDTARKAGIYDGAYNVVKLTAGRPY